LKERPFSLEPHLLPRKFFSRKRELDFLKVILFIMNFRTTTLSRELRRFFTIFGHSQGRVVSNSALCQARAKVKSSAFEELSEGICNDFYSGGKELIKNWHGMRLLGIDGTTFEVPQNTHTKEHFGVWGSIHKTSTALARGSMLFDVLNNFILDASLAPKKTGERELAYQHLKKVSKGDLLLLDRGYPCLWLLAAIMKRGADFCARIPIEKWKTLKKALRVDKAEVMIEYPFDKDTLEKCLKCEIESRSLTLRAINVELDNGEREVLVTSLTDPELTPHDFKQLYHQRWAIEESYKALKERLQLENFSGKTIRTIYQDFYAKILIYNLSALFITPANNAISAKTKKRKLKYKANISEAYSILKRRVVPFLLGNMVIGNFKQILAEIVEFCEPVRRNRKYERKYRVRAKKFAWNYLPIS